MSDAVQDINDPGLETNAVTHKAEDEDREETENHEETESHADAVQHDVCSQLETEIKAAKQDVIQLYGRKRQKAMERVEDLEVKKSVGSFAVYVDLT